MLNALFCKKEPDLSLLTEVLEVLVCSVGFSGVRFQVSTASGNQRHVAGTVSEKSMRRGPGHMLNATLKLP